MIFLRIVIAYFAPDLKMNWHSIIFKNSIYFKAFFKDIAYHFYDEPRPEKWVFIVGCYNSGTTLLANLLGVHPDIGNMPLEGRRFTGELPNADEYGIPRLWATRPELFYLDETMGDHINVSKIKRQWAYMYNDRRRKVLLEKSPVNAGRTRWFQKHFANSHFIVLIRDGYAVAEGIRRKAGHPIEKSILQWVNSNEILLKDLPFLENKIIIKYEDMTENPIRVFKFITDFLHISNVPLDTLSKEFRIHERKDKVENFNAHSYKNLNEADIQTINKIGGSTLIKLGYKLV